MVSQLHHMPTTGAIHFLYWLYSSRPLQPLYLRTNTWPSSTAPPSLVCSCSSHSSRSSPSLSLSDHWLSWEHVLSRLSVPHPDARIQIIVPQEIRPLLHLPPLLSPQFAGYCVSLPVCMGQPLLSANVAALPPESRWWKRGECASPSWCGQKKQKNKTTTTTKN